MVELRSAYFGFEFSAVQLSCITNVLVLPETPSGTGVDITGCLDITVTDNTFSGMDYGVKTHGTCSGINVSNNVHIGGNEQVNFATGTSRSRSGGHVVRSTTINEFDSLSNTSNRIYQGMGYSGRLILDSAQAIPDDTETAIIWTDPYDSGDGNLINQTAGLSYFWQVANPSYFVVPVGVNYVRLTAGIRWTDNATGGRVVKIRDSDNRNWAASATVAENDTTFGSSVTLSTPIIRVKPETITYFEVIVYQNRGGAATLDVLASADGAGVFFDMEILG
jgi:hypothetical protein